MNVIILLDSESQSAHLLNHFCCPPPDFEGGTKSVGWKANDSVGVAVGVVWLWLYECE